MFKQIYMHGQKELNFIFQTAEDLISWGSSRDTETVTCSCRYVSRQISETSESRLLSSFEYRCIGRWKHTSSFCITSRWCFFCLPADPADMYACFRPFSLYIVSTTKEKHYWKNFPRIWSVVGAKTGFCFPQRNVSQHRLAFLLSFFQTV